MITNRIVAIGSIAGMIMEKNRVKEKRETTIEFL